MAVSASTLSLLCSDVRLRLISLPLLLDLSHLNHNSAKLLTPKEEIEETAKEMVRRRTASNDAKSNKVDASAGAKTK